MFAFQSRTKKNYPKISQKLFEKSNLPDKRGNRTRVTQIRRIFTDLSERRDVAPRHPRSLFRLFKQLLKHFNKKIRR